MKNVKRFLASLPNSPGIYQMLNDNGQVIYVGKAKNLKKRVSSYFSRQAKDPKTLTLVNQIQDIDFTVTRSENEAVLLECNLIKENRPKYNILLRDDKSYPYILLSTQHDFPRIDTYRGVRKKTKSRLFGPYPNAVAVRETIRLLQKLFRLRTCKDSYFEGRSRPCLLHQIGRCTGPCVGLINKLDYSKNVNLAIKFLQGEGDEVVAELQDKMESFSKSREYESAAFVRDQILRLRQIQEKQYIDVKHGDIDVLGCAMSAGVVCVQLLSIRGGRLLGSRSYFPSIRLNEEIGGVLSSFISQHYLTNQSQLDNLPKQIITPVAVEDQDWLASVLSERSKKAVRIHYSTRGEKKKWLNMAASNAKQSLLAHLTNKSNMQERYHSLKSELNLASIPARIECFDISHSMGEATVASCVVFDKSGARKKDYRKFNIKGVTKGDDVAAMRQAVMRRCKQLETAEIGYPDLMLIDGGKTQLNAAARVLSDLQLDSIYLVSVSKGQGRKAGYELLHFLNQPPTHLPNDSPALHLIQQIRDEAHRFAIAGHRMQRDKSRKKSVIEGIPGVGAKRRRELLRYFGGIQGLARASLDEILKVPGISSSLAERIYLTFHDMDK